ncbi:MULTISPECIES: PQQ-dependent sugar dehydrogenase [Sphingobium]|uniref:PQQ-dependent sugar dehydrogenase n=1 Tax=Sphingobium TaxID=165695 RepID=UPI00242DEBBE|nr:PQQ-dependent sugar dehydrogenase [Sphingobium yanoikuyae]
MTFRLHARALLRVTPAAAVLLSSLAILSSCGGEDEGDAATSVNQPPVFTSANHVSVMENADTSFYKAAATDPDGNILSYSIGGGADGGVFRITAAGDLSFVTPPSFEMPADADRDNVYQVTINVSDGRGSVALPVTVTVTDSKEGIAVHRVATGFSNPVAIAPVSATAVLVAEKAGTIYLLNPQDGSRTVLARLDYVGATGVLALAATPTYASDGIFSVMYVTREGRLVITRFLYTAAGVTVPDNFGALLTVPAPHYAGGGWLGYDAAGVLWAATGDAGGSGDPDGSAQSSGSQLGKLIRFERNRDPYAGAVVELFLTSTVGQGLHRPNGGSSFNGGIILADRGQDMVEELNVLTPGAGMQNFGWPYKEGSQAVGGTPPAALVDPVLAYPHTGGSLTGQAIVGGAMGPGAVASLRDQYVFGDGSGAIFTVAAALLSSGGPVAADRVERRNTDFAPDRGRIDQPIAITAGPDGTLYILDFDGELFRVDAG